MHLCKNCGVLERLPFGNRHGKALFCGRECALEYKQKERLKDDLKRKSISANFQCSVCGGGYKRRSLKRIKSAKTCSDECSNKSGKTPYLIRKTQPAYIKYVSETRKQSIQWRIAKRLRNRMREMLDGCKHESALKLLGCSIEDFKSHIQSQFKKGMAWNNYGDWHIDHIQPCASYDLQQEQHRKLCFHYSNMRPLWKIENQMKGDRITVKQGNLI